MAWCELVMLDSRYYVESRFSLEHPSSTSLEPTVTFVETTEYVGSGMSTQKADVYKRTTEVTEKTYNELIALKDKMPYKMADNILKYVEQWIEKVYERRFSDQFIRDYTYSDNELFFRMLEMLSMTGKFDDAMLLDIYKVTYDVKRIISSEEFARIFNEAQLRKHPNKEIYLKILDNAIKVLKNADVSDIGICVVSQEEASKAAIESVSRQNYTDMWQEILLMVNEYTRYSGRKNLCGKDIKLYKNTFTELKKFLV